MAKTGSASAAFKDLTKEELGFAAVLKDRISDSLLPGEKLLDGTRLDEAAAFVVEAARTREDGKPAILIRSEADGRRYMRIAIINKDMPFLVDSIAAAMAARGLAIDVLVHPILPVRRREDALVDVPEGDGTGEKKESWVYIETARVDAKERRELESELSAAILDVRATVADWPKMRDAMAEDADRLPDAEGAALLRWLGDGMMTLLGHVTRKRDGKTTDAFGICRRSTPDLLADDAFDRAFAWFDGEGDGTGGHTGRAPLIIKANRLSKVHRRVPLDLFIVPRMEKGRVEALSVHAGIWTSAALVASPDSVPVLRQQLKTIMDRLDFEPGSHDGKSLVHALTALPHDLIISFSDDDITRVATAMMGLADRPRPRATLVTAPLGRHVFAFVWLPRDMLSTAVRLQMQDMLETQTGASTLDWSLMVEGGNLALLRYVIDFRGKSDHRRFRSCRRGLGRYAARLAGRGRGCAVEKRRPQPRCGVGRALCRELPQFLPHHLQRRGSGSRHRPPATRSPPRRRRASRGAMPGCIMSDADRDELLRLKVYQHHGSLPLSDAVPALENFGFRVLSEIPTRLQGEDAGTIHDFTLALPTGIEHDEVLSRSADIEEAISGVLNARAEDDVFNRLVVAIGLAAQGSGLAARLLPLSAPGRHRLHHLHRGRCAGRRAQGDARADRPVRRAARSCLQGRPGQGDRRAATMQSAPGWPKSTAINDDRLLRLYWTTRARDPAHQRLRPARRRGAGLQVRFRAGARPAQAACRGARSSSIRAGSKASTCAPGRSRAAACAGPTGATISAPKCSA